MGFTSHLSQQMPKGEKIKEKDGGAGGRKGGREGARGRGKGTKHIARQRIRNLI